MDSGARDPYEIIYGVARYLEKASAERGYAQHIIDNIHTIYGEALREPKPLADEIKPSRPARNGFRII